MKGILLARGSSDARVTQPARSLEPAAPGELEITHLNRIDLGLDALQTEPLDCGCASFGTDTPTSLPQAAAFVQAVQDRQRPQLGSLEEIAIGVGYIDAAALARQAVALGKTVNGQYLPNFAEGRHI